MKRLLLVFLLVAAGFVLIGGLPATGSEPRVATGLLQTVEARRGQALSEEQRGEFARALARLDQAIQPPQQTFILKVAQVFALPPGKLRDLLPAAGAENAGLDGIAANIQSALGRRMTAAELQQLRIADNAKQAETNEILSRYSVELGRIAGLTAEQMRRVFPTAGI